MAGLTAMVDAAKKMKNPGFGRFNVGNADELAKSSKHGQDTYNYINQEINKDYGWLGSGLRNAAYGAMTGGIAGAANLFGDDTMGGRFMSGAMIGGLTGGVSGMAFNKMNRGEGAIGGNTKTGEKGFEMGFMSEGNRYSAYHQGNRNDKGDQMLTSMTGRMSNLVGGLSGFIAGGFSKRNTTIDSNGWSRGTSPDYFAGGRM